MISGKIKIKNTKKLDKVRRMRGILTFFVFFPFSTSLNFSKFFGTSYGMNIFK